MTDDLTPNPGAAQAPAGHTFDSLASHGGLPSPFLFKLLVCFMAVAGLEGVVELVAWATTRPAVTSISYDPFAPNIPFTVLWVAVHFLLAGLLLLRSSWGRMWTQAIFVIHILYVAQEIAVRNPDLWVYLTGPGRMRLLATLAVDVVAIAWLATPAAQRATPR